MDISTTSTMEFKSGLHLTIMKPSTIIVDHQDRTIHQPNINPPLTMVGYHQKQAWSQPNMNSPKHIIQRERGKSTTETKEKTASVIDDSKQNEFREGDSTDIYGVKDRVLRSRMTGSMIMTQPYLLSQIIS